MIMLAQYLGYNTHMKFLSESEQDWALIRQMFRFSITSGVQSALNIAARISDKDELKRLKRMAQEDR